MSIINEFGTKKYENDEVVIITEDTETTFYITTDGTDSQTARYMNLPNGCIRWSFVPSNAVQIISINGTDSYFQFQYFKNINIAEKTIFKVSTVEELQLFLNEIKAFISTSKLRYFEAYLSAYNSEHQALFFNAGFKPTGYIPAFKYNRIMNDFEDQVVFVHHEKELDKFVYLIPETEEFLKTIKYYKELQKK